ncbi:T9SS type A sorting domain-containing protein [Paraflavisolibacter sp. H34]|uniref:T9SS type A sorting domain-containing protein n=1 Tax=Huijunlia imazamoxiresistens TaxID=3127457 RepID=UPI003016DF57
MNKNSRLMRRLIVAAPMLFCFFHFAPLQDWAGRYNGPANGGDRPSALAADALGNVYVTGESSGSQEDFATLRYDAGGVQKWVARYNGPGNAYDKSEAIATDAAGNVYVGGTSTGSGSGMDFALIKYDAGGVQKWVSRYNGPANDREQVGSVAVDKAGNVYVYGTSADGNGQFSYATIKYNSSGVQQWVARYPAGKQEINASAVDAWVSRGLAVDKDGNVFIAGYQAKGDTYPDFVTIKYNSSGKQLWANTFDGTGNSYDLPVGLALDPGGNVYVAGVSYGSTTSWDYMTMKYNTGGTRLWAKRYNTGSSGYDIPTSLVVDANSNVYVTGGAGPDDESMDFTTLKFNKDGERKWVATYKGPYGDDMAYSVAVDAGSNVFVTGYSAGPGSGGATVKYSSSGSQQWVERFSGTRASCLALGGSKLFVTGTSYTDGAGEDYLTVRYSGAAAKSEAVTTAPEQMLQPSSLLKVTHYPNPVAATATIRYELPFEGRLSLRVYDGLGREVATLANATTARAGLHTAAFDASSLEKGVYFYRLSLQAPAGKWTQTNKLIVVK